MAQNLSRKLIRDHLRDGDMSPGSEIGLRADQVLLQDVLGTLVMLELEAMGVERVAVDVAVQYVDHNLLETDNLNQEEHQFLRSACRRFGFWYARPGTGISHPTHMQRFGKPGDCLVGCDSHTAAAGSLGMFSVGMGGIDVALAAAGDPFYLRMPEIMGVKLVGELPPWVSAKDVALEMLRRHGVEGGFGRIVEYYGPGLACLSAMDRHVIANLGAELGATTTVFPSDERTREFLRQVGREDDWQPFAADDEASYDHHETIDLSALEPMIATPSSPGNVLRVRDCPKVDVYQTYIGSSANPGYRDLAVAAAMVKGRAAHERVSFDINPSTRQVFEQLIKSGCMADLVAAGARIHQPGCNGCIGMGQAPARGRPSLRTVPRNFPGRSGTKEDAVYLCSPETAAASALTGVITDPRDLHLPWPTIVEPDIAAVNQLKLVPPPAPEIGRTVRLETTDNIVKLPDLAAPGEDIVAVVLLKTGDDVSTDDIVPAGAEVLPRWSNIHKTAEFSFRSIDGDYARNARAAQQKSEAHAIVGGSNYGQGSSRENAALAPRTLGLQLVLAKSFARIHWQNLINFGVLPLTFVNPSEYDALKSGDRIRIVKFAEALATSKEVEARVEPSGATLKLRHDLSERQLTVMRSGSVIDQWREARNRRNAS